MHSVHKMQPIAAENVAWTVCLSVCHIRKSCKKDEQIEMLTAG